MEKAIQVISLSQLDNVNLDDYDLVYFWVDTCAFKYRFDYENIDRNYLEKYKKKLSGKKIVFVSSLIPKFVEDNFFSFLSLLIDVFLPEIEITINDWWVFNYLKNNGYLWKLKINIWPNFYYHVKDPYASCIEPEKFKKISIDKQFYNDYYKKLWFSWLEFFYPLHWIEFEFLDFDKYLYFPYVQYSFTRACPWSLLKAGEKVSKLILDCSGCDKNYYKQQVRQNLKWKNLLTESIYLPNWQYYDISNYIKLETIKKNIKPTRIIYNYLLIDDGIIKK